MAKKTPPHSKAKRPPPAKRVPKRKLTPKIQATPRQVDLEEAIAAKKAVKVELPPLRPASKTTPRHVSSAVERAIARAEGRDLPEPEHPSKVPYSDKSRETLLKGPTPGAAPTPPPPSAGDAPPAARVFSSKGKRIEGIGSGRLSSFKEEYIAQSERLCALGLTDEELAKFFGVSVRTLYRWKGQFPLFCQAIKTGGAESDERVERSLYKRAVGYETVATKIFMPAGAEAPVYAKYIEQVQPDTTAAIFWLKNRRKEQWRDVSKHEHTGKDGEPLTEMSADAAEIDRARRLALLLARGAEAKQRESTKH